MSIFGLLKARAFKDFHVNVTDERIRYLLIFKSDPCCLAYFAPCVGITTHKLSLFLRENQSISARKILSFVAFVCEGI